MYKNKINPVKIQTQNQALDAIRSANIMVGSVSAGGTVSFASNPVAHNSSVSARLEAKRLAALEPGKLFVLVQLVGAEMLPTQSEISI